MRSCRVFGCDVPLNVLVFFAVFALVILVGQAEMFAQAPWEMAADRAAFSFQRIARPVSIVAIVIGALMVALLDGGMRIVGGVVAGVLLALNAAMAVDFLQF